MIVRLRKNEEKRDSQAVSPLGLTDPLPHRSTWASSREKMEENAFDIDDKLK